MAGLDLYSLMLQNKKTDEREASVKEWKSSRDADLTEAFKAGKKEDWISPGSVLRPRNFNMLLSTHQTNSPSHYDNAVGEYEKRLEYNNWLNSLQKSAGESGYELSPWLMMDQKPPRPKKNGKEFDITLPDEYLRKYKNPYSE